MLSTNQIHNVSPRRWEVAVPYYLNSLTIPHFIDMKVINQQKESSSELWKSWNDMSWVFLSFFIVESTIYSAKLTDCLLALFSLTPSHSLAHKLAMKRGKNLSIAWITSFAAAVDTTTISIVSLANPARRLDKSTTHHRHHITASAFNWVNIEMWMYNSSVAVRRHHHDKVKSPTMTRVAAAEQRV